VAESGNDSGMPQMKSIENAHDKDGTYEAISTSIYSLAPNTPFQAPSYTVHPALLCRPPLLRKTYSTMKLVLLFAALCAASPLIIQIDGNEDGYGKSCIEQSQRQRCLQHTGNAHASIDDMYRQSSLVEKLFNNLEVQKVCIPPGSKCSLYTRFLQHHTASIATCTQ
jgi:hypothetical protein